MRLQPSTITLTPAQVRAVTNALRHNAADCQHPLDWGVRRGCGACRALHIWLEAVQPKGHTR